jgi:hypothetical protein
MGPIIKLYFILFLLLTIVASGEGNSNKTKKDEATICVRWQWATTAAEGKVNCIEWAKQDCSNRLHKDICKKGG